MMPEVLLLAPLPEFLLVPLRVLAQLHDHTATPDPETLLNAVSDRIRAVVMTGGTTLPEALLKRLPALEIVSVFGVGYDGVPLEACRARGIRVTNTPDVLTDDVADLAVALVLMTSRRLSEAERFLRAGTWATGEVFPLAHALRGKTAGIVGLGRIGKAIAQRLSAHGLNIAYHGRKEQTEVPYAFEPTLIGLAVRSDFLILACPGGSETQHLVNADVLSALGSEGTLINIARGSVVDEAALVAALQRGELRSAGLDVFAGEPQVPAELIANGRLVLLPHVGSATVETRQAMAELCVGNLAAHFMGRPLLTPVC